MSKIAILGASGFVGTAVVRQARAAGHEVHAFARSTGSSWELSRQGIEVRRLNLGDRDATQAALQGFDAVINCMRGGNMIGTLDNTLHAVKANGIARFVHLSSISIYGDYPDPASAGETAAPAPTNEYGAMKLEQDELVMAAAARGDVRAVILCPPNITGPGSGFITDIVKAVASRQFVRADGDWVCAMVDVDNLAHAALCAVASNVSGARYFVTDNDSITWARLVETLQPLAGNVPVRSVDPEILRAAAGKPQGIPKPSFRKALKRLVAPEIRSALAAEPFFYNLFAGMKAAVFKLPKPVLKRIASVASPPVSVSRLPLLGDANVRLSAQQLRGVDHSCAAAMREIGYTPLYDTEQSLRRFSAWYTFMWPPSHGEGRPGAPVGTGSWL